MPVSTNKNKISKLIHHYCSLYIYKNTAVPQVIIVEGKQCTKEGVFFLLLLLRLKNSSTVTTVHREEQWGARLSLCISKYPHLCFAPDDHLFSLNQTLSKSAHTYTHIYIYLYISAHTNVFTFTFWGLFYHPLCRLRYVFLLALATMDLSSKKSQK